MYSNGPDPADTPSAGLLAMTHTGSTLDPADQGKVRVLYGFTKESVLVLPAGAFAQSIRGLVGEWRPLECNRQDAIGAMVLIYGPKPVAILIYTTSGAPLPPTGSAPRSCEDTALRRQVS